MFIVHTLYILEKSKLYSFKVLLPVVAGFIVCKNFINDLWTQQM